MAADQPVQIVYRPEDIEAIYERRLRFAESAWDKASTYDAAITVAGYAAFFALWSQVAGDVSPAARTLIAALLGVSLLLYIGWAILLMLTRHWHDREFAALIGTERQPIEAINAWDSIERRRNRALLRVQRFWWPVFGTSALAGMGGGLLLIYSCLARTFGLPAAL